LEDDGIPQLAEQLKQIRMKMEDKQHLKLVRAEKVSSHHRTISNDRDSKYNDSQGSQTHRKSKREETSSMESELGDQVSNELQISPISAKTR
jgi:hypothetical protein